MRGDVDGVFAGQKHPAGGTSPLGWVRTQRVGLYLQTQDTQENVTSKGQETTEVRD